MTIIIIINWFKLTEKLGVILPGIIFTRNLEIKLGCWFRRRKKRGTHQETVHQNPLERLTT